MTTPGSAYVWATEWLFAKLTDPPIADVVGVFEDDAPEGTTTATDTWVEFEAQAPGDDVSEVAEQRIVTEFTFLVRAVSRGRSTKALGLIATAIDQRLHRASGICPDGLGQVIQASRTAEEQDRWLEQGVEYRALGGQYNLIVQPVTA